MNLTGINGEMADVDKEGRLQVRAVAIPEAKQQILDGDGFVWDFTGYDYDAADTVMFIRNDHPDKNLVIDAIELYGDTASKIQVHCPANPTVAGTEITGTNWNRAKGGLPLATAYQDETGNTQANIIKTTYTAANAVTDLLRENECIVLGYHQCLGVDLVTAGTMAYGQIVGHYE